MATQQVYGPQLPKAPTSGSYGPEAPWDAQKKKQFLQSHGYSEGEAQSMMMGGNPMQKQAPKPAAPVQPQKAGAGMAQKGLAVHPDAYESLKAQGQTPDFIADQMAQSSPHFASQLAKIRKKFGGDPAATEAFLNTRFYGDTSYAPNAPTEKKGYIGRTLDRIYQAGTGVQDTLNSYNQGDITAGQAAIRGSQKIFSGILSPALEASSSVVGYGLEKTGAGEAIAGLAQDVASSNLGQTVAPYVNRAVEGYQNLPEDSGFRDLASIGKAGLDALDVYGTGKTVKYGGNLLKQTAQHPLQTIRHPVNAAKLKFGGQPAAPVSQGPRELVGKAKEAVDKGVDRKFMEFVGEQNPDTRAVMSKMTDAAKEGSEKLGGTLKHKEILGGQMMENAAHVLQEKQNVGKALKAMKTAVADDIVDLSDDYMEVLTQLQNKGAVINDKGKIISLAGASDDNIPLLQQTLDFLQPDDAGRVIKKGKDIDLWRSKMFEEMNSAKAKLQPSAAGQSTFGFAENVTNKARRSALTRMAKGNRNLLAANDAYEELSTEASKFLKAIGYKGKLNVDAITAKDLKAGEIALRTLGNASADSREAFTSLIQTARKYGRISNVDEMALIRYADALEDLFPITPTRSLAGQVSRGTRDAAGNLIEDVVGGGSIKKGILNRASEPVMKIYDKIRGLTPENQYRLLKEVLDSPPDTPFFTVAQQALPDEIADDLGRARGVDAGDMKPIAQDELSRLTPEEKATGIIGGSDYPDNLDDVPLSQLDPQGVTDAAQAEAILKSGGSLDDALKTANDNVPPKQ